MRGPALTTNVSKGQESLYMCIIHIKLRKEQLAQLVTQIIISNSTRLYN